MITIFASGNIGADAELSTTPKGKTVANFRLGSKNRQGETEWLRCQVWGERAENLHPYLKKGTYLVITGYPDVFGWQDKETGDIRTLMTVMVNDLDFGSAVGGPKRNRQASAGGEDSAQSTATESEEVHA